MARTKNPKSGSLTQSGLLLSSGEGGLNDGKMPTGPFPVDAKLDRRGNEKSTLSGGGTTLAIQSFLQVNLRENPKQASRDAGEIKNFISHSPKIEVGTDVKLFKTWRLSAETQRYGLTSQLLESLLELMKRAGFESVVEYTDAGEKYDLRFRKLNEFVLKAEAFVKDQRIGLKLEKVAVNGDPILEYRELFDTINQSVLSYNILEDKKERYIEFVGSLLGIDRKAAVRAYEQTLSFNFGEATAAATNVETDMRLAVPEGALLKYDKSKGDIFKFLLAAYAPRPNGAPLTLDFLRENDPAALAAFRSRRRSAEIPPSLLVLTDQARGSRQTGTLKRHGVDVDTPDGIAEAKRLMSAISNAIYPR